jgi:hypothetical protein
MRKFSTRYGMNTTPSANGPGSGDSTISLGVGSLSMGTTVLWARAPAVIAVSSASAFISWFIACSPFEIQYKADDATGAPSTVRASNYLEVSAAI